MVGKRRLNKRQRRGQRVKMLSRGVGRIECFNAAPFQARSRPFASEVSSPDCFFLQPLNHTRIPANSMGRRSDCQRRKTPPTRKTKSASHTPAAGGSVPCFANETPIKE